MTENKMYAMSISSDEIKPELCHTGYSSVTSMVFKSKQNKIKLKR
jgi:hypothetical protein